MNPKEQIYTACQNNIDNKIAAIQSRLQSIQEARNNETKSSVGDKYETGRAMMQMEEDNCKAQLAQTNALRRQLAQINPRNQNEKVELGSLVQTNKGVFYVSVGIGKIQVEDKMYFCISLASPIGKQLQHKMAGDEIVVNNNRIKIEAVG